jgi:hypothetical protein
MMRVMLYEAAQSMLHSKKWSWLKAAGGNTSLQCCGQRAWIGIQDRAKFKLCSVQIGTKGATVTSSITSWMQRTR